MRKVRPSDRPIMVTDSDFASRKLSRLFLEKNGYTVREAPDASSALRFLSEGMKPSLMLVDSQLPEMHASEFIDVVRRQNESMGDVPIIVISADDSAENRRQCESANGFLVKPVALGELLRLVNNHLD